MPTPWSRAEGNTGCTAIARCTRIPRGQRPRACTEAPCAETGRSHVCLRGRELQTVSGSRRTYADDERVWDVGQFHSTCEVAEQSRGNGSGGTEGRELAKGNSPERNAPQTQGRNGAPSALERVRQAASKDRKQRFTALLHHIYDVERLRAAYRTIKKDAAAGVDGQTWEHYGEALEANLQDFSHRLKRGAYRARPVRRVYIPKVGKPGELRPLGVPALEEKIVQRATVEVWNSI
jgi:hypothetical protein